MRIGAYSLAGRYVQTATSVVRRLINAVNWLEDGERILTVVAAVDNVTTPPLVINSIVIGPDFDRFAYYASGGVEGEEYIVTFTVSTSAGQTRVDEIEISIVEVARG